MFTGQPTGADRFRSQLGFWFLEGCRYEPFPTLLVAYNPVSVVSPSDLDDSVPEEITAFSRCIPRRVLERRKKAGHIRRTSPAGWLHTGECNLSLRHEPLAFAGGRSQLWDLIAI